MSTNYGSAKSSGSISESSGSSSGSGSGSTTPESSSSGSSASSSSGSGSSGLICDWEITDLAYVADDTMDFTVTNNSPDALVITDITLSVSVSYFLNLTPPQTVPGNGSLAFRVVADGDLRGARVTVTTEHCGDKYADFPIGP